MNSLFKELKQKIVYVCDFCPLLMAVKNPIDVLALFFAPKHFVLQLNNGLNFSVKHHLDAHIVKEVVVDDVYGITQSDQKINTVIDIGAHIGTFSLLASKAFPSAKIFAIEPNPKTFSTLQKNCQLNQTKNVVLANLAVSDKEGLIDMYPNSTSGLATVITDKADTEKNKAFSVRSTTLAKFMVENAIAKCDLLKIDCEGSEYVILNSLRRTDFAKIRSITMEYHKVGVENKLTTLVRLLRKVGFFVKVKENPLDNSVGNLTAFKRQ